MSTESSNPDEIMASLASSCKIATPQNAVNKSECAYTFHSPYSNGDAGILVNLSTFLGSVPEMAKDDKASIFLRIVQKRIAKDLPESKKEAPTKLAIGGADGFATDAEKYETVSTHSVVVQECGKVLLEKTYDNETKKSLPQAVQDSVDSIINHVGTAVQQDVTAWQDDEVIPVSKYCETIPFVDNGVTISPDPKTWKCESSGDTENLWLNLSDGYIGGGRKNWDGSGGSNGALDHFNATDKKYPLVVKLGTISSSGSEVTADCYSYAPDEDGPVKIPNLAELLQKRGIHVAGLQKTVKSTAELEVELNANYDFDAITEKNAKLVPVSGPGLQGLQNMGNSCYLNSVLQLLCMLPPVAKVYGTEPGNELTNHPLLTRPLSGSPCDDLLVQMTKVTSALTSGAFALPEELLSSDESLDPKYRLAPRMLKNIIGCNHSEFRTGHQQDAAELLQYLLELLDKAEQSGEIDRTVALFSFQTSTRLVCTADQKIKYTSSSPETIWSLPIPMEKAKAAEPTKTEGKEVEPELKRQKQDDDDDTMAMDDKEGEKEEPASIVMLSDCIDSWAAESTVADYRWPHLGKAIHPASQTVRFATFPKFLWLQVQRYTLGPDWQPIKLHVELQLPTDEILDLTCYRRGPVPADGEELVPEEAEGKESGGNDGGASSQPEVDEMALVQLTSMGFGINGCKRALMKVGGSDVEAAMNWIFEHNTDPDFDDPITEATSSNNNNSQGNDDEAVIQNLVASLGCFTFDQVKVALRASQGAPDRAAEWLFSNMDDLDSAVAKASAAEAEAPSSSPTAPIALDDGEGKYRLAGMVSHIGKNTGSGHYVAHAKRGDRWIIYNDEKVAVSQDPPTAHAYLYLFERIE